MGGGSHVVIIGALPIVGPDLQPALVPFLQLGLLCWCWCHPGGVWGTLVGTGHGQSGGCVRKTSTKSFSFCYVFGSLGGFSLGQLYISSTSQLLFGLRCEEFKWAFSEGQKVLQQGHNGQLSPPQGVSSPSSTSWTIAGVVGAIIRQT